MCIRQSHNKFSAHGDSDELTSCLWENNIKISPPIVLLRRSSFCSMRSIGRRFVSVGTITGSIRLVAPVYAHYLQIFFPAMSALVFRFSSCHLLVSILRPGIASLVGGSRRMCPMKRLILVATVSYNAVCPDGSLFHYCTVSYNLPVFSTALSRSAINKLVSAALSVLD